MDERGALSRRAFVGKVSKGAAGTALALSFAATNSLASNRDELNTDGVGVGADDTAAAITPQAQPVSSVNAEQSVPAPWDLVRPLSAGASVAGSWRLAALTGAVEGSCVATLENESGRAHRVHICRNDGQPSGLVYTDRFELVVMNGGRGDLPTEESFGQAVAELAHVIASNEAVHEDLARELLPQSAREQQFAATARLR